MRFTPGLLTAKAITQNIWSLYSHMFFLTPKIGHWKNGSWIQDTEYIYIYIYIILYYIYVNTNRMCKGLIIER